MIPDDSTQPEHSGWQGRPGVTHVVRTRQQTLAMSDDDSVSHGAVTDRPRPGSAVALQVVTGKVKAQQQTPRPALGLRRNDLNRLGCTVASLLVSPPCY